MLSAVRLAKLEWLFACGRQLGKQRDAGLQTGFWRAEGVERKVLSANPQNSSMRACTIVGIHAAPVKNELVIAGLLWLVLSRRTRRGSDRPEHHLFDLLDSRALLQLLQTLGFVLSELATDVGPELTQQVHFGGAQQAVSGTSRGVAKAAILPWIIGVGHS